ncbi:hypothetical protein HPB52_024304 [Rhipicephalus sanguineus]|uniref:Uncharacterized protein n=1 Tax=Rhipicephalus sanguineus TaxID=34632 RepID=A0A9D4TCM0_RHISA|nr:hypothetical protein HPB52_024304 [Rhipicephalus sanguineus]
MATNPTSERHAYRPEHRSDPPVRSLICLPRVGLGHDLTGLAFHLYHLESRRGRRRQVRDGFIYAVNLRRKVIKLFEPL